MQSISKTASTKIITQPIFKWLLLLTILAVLVGSLVALFLWLLDQVTYLRWQNSWLLFLLPFAGILIFVLYQYWGKGSEAGNGLLIDAIHNTQTKVPARMAPLVLLTTLITHLFGGSAGREGTAVQMGGGMAAFVGRWFVLKEADLRLLLMCGMAAGFAAVFGTPIAGAVFAVEVIAIGRIQYKELLPCFFTSIIAHLVCLAWGIEHTKYIIHFSPNDLGQFFHFDALLLGKTIIAAIGFGLAAFLFAEAHLQVKTIFHKWIPIKWLIPVAGGLLVIGLTYWLDTRDYLGLGVVAEQANGVSILSAFKEDGVSPFSWFWKLLFTAITLGTGFKGGEVTPLFFVGAALGNTLGWIMGAPIDLFAALGFIAVFAGATNTVLACTIMACELFGTDFVLYFFVACLFAKFASGYSSIYPTQRMGHSGKKVSEHPTYSLQKIWEHLKGK
ncbi:MAG: voltage-gated chloride channel protein [Bacteroidetes bacterium 24-39-8]|jgi:H+/Cl- antiporter ClcA|nr:MAG: voltage-gated chloride channel protein [Sphingobacteriia bacterium 35-40-8]OYZ52450.1 MAG: voltage-gated chloride channel protein [Bacteroidetes bacterium 24-39-8]OZA69326.1 MAG: voltage-gated chloride channel protein [Sphingobacteriia bacterium 39-39-8]HQR93149.1 voltage-gated chloride channel family protein [Sediminibacterium sp.]HQS54602.1 voltage-gated chloride channel family protein [Sediminibacterium sp.]